MRRFCVWVVGVVLAANPAVSRAEGRVGLERGWRYAIDTVGTAGGLRLPGFTVPSDLPSLSFERLLQIAPEERALAAWSPSARLLVVVAADGTERAQVRGANGAFRFAPDGSRLAFAGDHGVEILALASGQRSVVAKLSEISELAWTRAGVVALHGPVARRKISLISTTGDVRLLATTGAVQAFAAAGDHVVWASGGALFDADVSTSAAPVRVPLAKSSVELLALSPDGARALFSTRGGVYLRDGAAAPRAITDTTSIHSLGFAPDGKSLLWASAQSGELVRGDTRVALPRKSSSARFRHGRPGVVLTSSEGVYQWRPDTGALDRLGNLSDEQGRELAGDAMGDFVLALYWCTPPEIKRQMAPEPPQ